MGSECEVQRSEEHKHERDIVRQPESEHTCVGVWSLRFGVRSVRLSDECCCLGFWFWVLGSGVWVRGLAVRVEG